MQAGAECEPHQLVIRRVVLDRVDAGPEAVVRPQLRNVTVRLGSEQLHALAADEFAHLACPGRDPAPPLALNRFAEYSVARPRVVAREGWRLIRGIRRVFHEKSGHAAYCNELGSDSTK